MPSVLEITVNCPSKQVAEEIATKALAARLAAAANILGPVESLYRWEGATTRVQEIVLKLKTRPHLYTAVTELVSDIHPYEVPSILGQRIELVGDDYAAWVEGATAENQEHLK